LVLTTTVWSGVLFHWATDPEANPVPLIVKVKAGPPAAVEAGLSEPIAGPATMVKVTAFDVTPPDETVIRAVPALAIKLASTGAVSRLALPTLVASGVWFQFTTASPPNPLPFTVSVKAGPPAVAALGERLLMTGGATTVKFTAFEVTPPITTVMGVVPALAMSVAGTVAVNWVALTNLVDSVAVFQRMVEPDENPVPLTVSVKDGPPAVAVFGEIALMTGAGLIVKVTAFDVTAPDRTVIWAVPALAMRFAGTDAVIRLALTKVVVSWFPFHWTAAPDWKPLPFTVSVKAGPPAVALVGEMLVRAGAAVTVKLTEFDVKVFDTTVIGMVPGLATRLGNTVACSWVELTTFVTRGEPFHWTRELVANPAPFTVSVNAGAPAVAVLGLRELIMGLTVKLRIFDITPPDATATWATPAKTIRFAGTGAVNWVALTKVVPASAEPFHWTTASDAKPLPFTVRVNAGPPAAMLAGLRLVITGWGTGLIVPEYACWAGCGGGELSVTCTA
jgi:hypothetical protein